MAFVSGAVVRKGTGVKVAGARCTAPSVRTVVRAKVEESVGKGPAPPQQEDSYVRLAMRNMVQQGGKALLHFSMTASVMLLFFVGLAFLFK